jgi:hypothetical protein
MDPVRQGEARTQRRNLDAKFMRAHRPATHGVALGSLAGGLVASNRGWFGEHARK